jgi:hypothetical protein
MDSYRMDDAVPGRRRSWLLLVPVLLLIALAVAWSAFWFYAAGRARDTVAEWFAREAKSGRVYICNDRSVGGYPFRFELRCNDPKAELRAATPPLSVNAKHLLVALQVYQPKLLIAELTGPVTVTDPSQTRIYAANWMLGHASVRGTPRDPERVSIVLDDPVFERRDGAAAERLFSSKHTEIHGRIAGGSVRENPVIDVAFSLVGAIAPALHPLLGKPFDAEVDSQLVGLRNFDPKPWAQRFREIQQANGRIEVRAARFQQGDTLAVAAGSLNLSEAGLLEGELQVTVAGLDKLLPTLGADQLVPPDSAAGQRLDSALNSLDRLIPGLGGLARQKVGLGVAAGAALLGQPTELEGRKAVRLPLRLVNGDVLLGPIKFGKVSPLF